MHEYVQLEDSGPHEASYRRRHIWAVRCGLFSAGVIATLCEFLPNGLRVSSVPQAWKHRLNVVNFVIQSVAGSGLHQPVFRSWFPTSGQNGLHGRSFNFKLRNDVQQALRATNKDVKRKTLKADGKLKKVESVMESLLEDTDVSHRLKESGNMSNREKFIAIPVDSRILRRIEKGDFCVSAKEAEQRLRRSLVRENANIDTTRKRRGGKDPRLKFDKKGPPKDKHDSALVGNLYKKMRARYPLLGDLESGYCALVVGRDNTPSIKPGAKVISKESEMPQGRLPEVAFAGRSNVGKSSVINALTLSSVARSSAVPGKTQTLNFYSVNERLRIVDMPGYGFATASEKRKEKWNDLIDAYVTGREKLRRIYVLIDARHGLKVNDREFLSFLSRYGAVGCQVVLTKTDLVKQADLARRVYVIEEELRTLANFRPNVFMLSTSTGAGVVSLGRDLFAFAKPGSQELQGSPKGKDAKPKAEGSIQGKTQAKGKGNVQQRQKGRKPALPRLQEMIS